jgi:hypothetical protein
VPSLKHIRYAHLQYKNYEFLRDLHQKKLKKIFNFKTITKKLTSFSRKSLFDNFSIYWQKFLKPVNFLKKLTLNFYDKLKGYFGVLGFREYHAIPRVTKKLWAIDFSRRRGPKKPITWGYQRFLESRNLYAKAIYKQFHPRFFVFYIQLKNKNFIHKGFLSIKKSYWNIKRLIFSSWLDGNLLRATHAFPHMSKSILVDGIFQARGETIPRYFLRPKFFPQGFLPSYVIHLSSKERSLDLFFFIKIMSIKLIMLNHLSQFN